MISPPALAIRDLRQVPHFTQPVAECIWKAWWREQDVSLAEVRLRVEESLAGNGIPTTLVAHDGTRFVGTASLIACDMEERAQYRPWIAALWVEPPWRKAGIGTALVEAAAQIAFSLGTPCAYLCAEPDNVAFYTRMGWTRIEADVDGLDILVLQAR